MKKNLIATTCVLCAVAFSLSTAHADDPNDSVDSDDDGACRYALFIGNESCKVRNRAEVCDCE